MLTLGAAVVVLAAVCVWQWRRYRKTVKKVVFLFDALDNGDYTFRFPEKGKYDDDKLMNASLNRVKEILRHARDEQIEREKYFELIIDSVDTGILVLDDGRGVVLRCNKAALKLLQMEVVTHVNQIKDRLESLSVRDAYTTLKGRRVRIVAISDIKGELANQEIDSWVKLIRVLTHEIMNSIAPINSLCGQLQGCTDREKLREGLETIQSTSSSLMKFTEDYRKFAAIPAPVCRLFSVGEFIERMMLLFKGCGAEFTVEVLPAELIVNADEALIERVVVNLLKNSVEAGASRIGIRAGCINEQEQVAIDVSDDGQPVGDNIREQIFVPFFTTKKDGSGIGLPVSRRIMSLHNGSLQLIRPLTRQYGYSDSMRRPVYTKTFRLIFP